MFNTEMNAVAGNLAPARNAEIANNRNLTTQAPSESGLQSAIKLLCSHLDETRNLADCIHGSLGLARPAAQGGDAPKPIIDGPSDMIFAAARALGISNEKLAESLTHINS